MAVAASAGWPLAARRLYMSRAKDAINYLLPLCVNEPSAAFRVNALQSRWAMAVLVGHVPNCTRRVPKDVLLTLLQDLGWMRLWDEALVGAIVLRQRMVLDPPCYAHAAVARDISAPNGTWTAFVVRMQTRFGIPDFHLESPIEACTAQVVQRKLHEYKMKVVLPAVVLGLGHSFTAPPLPWGWIAAELSSATSSTAFENWWNLRTRGELRNHPPDFCPTCGAHTAPDAVHFSTVCPAIASFLRAQATSVAQYDLFASPYTAPTFRVQLSCVEFATLP